jgi:hypothetical protein
MRLLKITEDLKLEILPETLLIPEFKAVIKRTKKCKEDFDGRLKTIAKKELAYVYHMASGEGPYFSYEPKERHLRLANDLFEEHKWEPDNEVLAAIEKFKELDQTPASKTINTIVNALHKANRVIDTLIDVIETNMDEKKYDQGITNKQGQVITGVEIMLGDLQALIKTSNEIPKSLAVFEALQEKILREKQVKESRFKAGVEVNDFERS